MTDVTFKLEPTEGRRLQQMHVSLVFSSGDAVRAVALREGASLVVGRSEPSQVVIDDRSLSRTHARFSLENGRVRVEDLDSTNGTQLNGAPVREAFVGEGDVVRLGTLEARVSGHTDAAADARATPHHVFMRRLEDELARSRVFGRATTILAAVRPRSRSGGAQIVPPRPLDLGCAYAPTVDLLLLPETDLVAARAVAASLRPLGLAVGLAVYPTHATSSEELLSVALSAAHAATMGGPAVEADASNLHPSDAPVIESAPMRRLYDLVQRVARSPMPVLVLGETGVGKELVARAVHDKSTRSAGPFKAFNCATIPHNLIESVLFGHERGAFTGADKQAPGIFEQAQGGTVFLDEVGELSPAAQAALLRVLEQKKIVRVGGTREIDVDVRVVAATHRDLAAMVKAGTFREDLMFRLDALTLRVPALRERPEEIEPLAKHFLAHARGEWGATARELSTDALDALASYAWPGNVRQLKNVIERAATLCAGTSIELEDLPEQIWAEPADPVAATLPASSGTGSSLPERVREFEIALIREAMERAHGNVAEAARLLGVPRRTLSNKVHGYGLV